MRFRWICSLALVLSTRAAHADDAIHSLTLDRAVALALAHNPDNQSAAEDVAIAEGGLRQAHAFANPSVFVGAIGTNLSPLAAPLPNQVGVAWSIPIGGKRAAGIAIARADVATAQASRATARRQLAFDVQAKFVGVLLDAAQLDFARSDQADVKETQALQEIRYKDGKIAYGELLKLRIQARAADDLVRQAELTLATDRAELAQLVGNGVLADDFAVVGELTPPAVDTVPTAAELYARALARRSDYQASLAGERSAAAAVTAARRQPIPDLGASVAYNRVPGEAGAIDLVLSVDVPIFDRNRGAIDQAQATRRKAALATASLQSQLRADAQKAVSAWETAHARLALYDDELLAAAKESLDITQHAYEAGRGSLLDYLDAETSYRAVTSAYRAAVADAVIAAAQLRFVAGEDSP